MELPSLEPWIMGYGSVLERAQAQCHAAGLTPRVFDVLDPQSRSFFSLANACNQVSFGGLGMPAWVQLDCCTLPGLMVGWGGPSAAIDVSLRDKVHKILETPPLDDFWPYSEYCGITRGLDELVGMSSFSLVPRQGLALRAKALGLWLSQARVQIGMTQWDNPATALHCKFGPLEILSPRAHNHSRPEQTFVYQLQVPELEILHEMLSRATKIVTQAPAQGEHRNEPVDATLSAKVRAWIDQGHQVRILAWSPKKVRFSVA